MQETTDQKVLSSDALAPAGPMEPGIYYDLDEQIYRNDPALAQTDLKRLRRSPKMFLSGIEIDDEDKEDTEALILGRMTGQMAMEPNKKPWWVVKPEGLDGRTKEGMKWADENEGAVQVSYKTYTKACKMATSVLDHPIGKTLMKGAKCEVSVWADTETENGVVRRKGRIDIVPTGNVLVDIKTCLDPREDSFRRVIEKRGYDFQAAYYLDLWNSVCTPEEYKHYFLIIAVEKFPPFDLIVHRLDAEFMTKARGEYLDLCELYAKCRKTNQWPGYPAEINTIKLNQ